MDVDTESLITLVEERPQLWDKTLKIYNDKNKTRESWNEICRILYPPFDDLADSDQQTYGQFVLKRWNNVRDQYMKYKNKEMKSGAGTSNRKRRKYIHHDALQFLEKVRIHPKTICTFEPSDGEEKCPNEEDNAIGGTPSPEPSTTVPKAVVQPKIILIKEEKQKRKQEVETPEPESDRHLLFFKSVLPSISNFSEQQTIDFQMGVLQLIKDIHSQDLY